MKRRILCLPFAILLIAACSNSTGTPTAPPTATPAGPVSPRTSPALKWTFATQGAIWGSAAVRDGLVYIGSNWLESSPVMRNGNVYIGSSVASNLNVFSAATGDALPGFNVAAAAWSTPLVTDDAVFIGSEGLPGGPDLGGGVWAINIASGSGANSGSASVSRWFYQVSNSVEPTGINGVNSSPVMIDRVLYFGGLDGRLYALDI